MISPPGRERADPILEVENLVMHFPLGRGILQRRAGMVHAVNDVSFSIARGETLGLVGESGCGKSTVGRSILQIYRPTSGSVRFEGRELTGLSNRKMRPIRRRIQMIFQDPFSSLDPRMRVGRLVAEPLRIHRLVPSETIPGRVGELLELVGLRRGAAKRYPHEFSGGQRQRIAIARALAVEPSLLILDEPISSLDVSVQAQIVNLLEELQEELGLTYLFIAHDLSVVRHISDRVAVMYLGKIVESAERDELYARPLHPYTRALLSAVPIPDPCVERVRERTPLGGDVPSPVSPPSGCSFRTRCQLRQRLGEPERCTLEEPLLRELSPGHPAACHFIEEAAWTGGMEPAGHAGGTG